MYRRGKREGRQGRQSEVWEGHRSEGLNLVPGEQEEGEVREEEAAAFVSKTGQTS